MKFHAKAKVYLAALPPIENEHLPPIWAVLIHPYLDTSADPPVLVASDGKMLVTVPVEVQTGDEPGPVSAGILKAAAGGAGKDGLAEVQCKKELRVCKNRQGQRTQQTRPVLYTSYPNYRPLIPDKGRPNSMRVALNAKLLWNLAQALGSEGRVLLEIPAEEWDPIRVEPIHGDGVEGAVGVLMQIRKG